MNCRKARKKIPLSVRDDLSHSKLQRLNAHLEECSACQKEWQEYREILLKIKALAQREETRNWEEAEWKRLIKKITSEKMEEKQIPLRLSPKLALASGILFLILFGGVTLFIRNFFITPKEPAPLKPLQTEIMAKKEELQISKKEEKIKTQTAIPQQTLEKPIPLLSLMSQRQKPVVSQTRPTQAVSPAQKETGQDVLSMTFVSQETGLRIVWFFNKNFEWEDKK